VSREPYPARSRLGEDFYLRPVETVARDLLGRILVHRGPEGRIALRLVEVEAYLGQGRDPASHAHRGPTPRNRQMFETPGRLYVYLSYGVHHCVNVVCEPAGQGAAVLLRGAEVLEGEAVLAARRGRSGTGIANGPGKLGQALAAGPGWDGRTLLRGELGLWPGSPPREIASSSRIGISRAKELRLRFFDPSSACVSRARPAL
jgi:DNA-3-methyladenine glycosylase